MGPVDSAWEGSVGGVLWSQAYIWMVVAVVECGSWCLGFQETSDERVHGGGRNRVSSTLTHLGCMFL